MVSISESLQSLGNSLSLLNPVILNIIAALIILFVGFVLGRILSNLLRRLLLSVGLDASLSKLFRSRIRLEGAISEIVAWAIYLLSVILALNQVHVLNIVISWLSYIIILLVILSFLLAAKDVFPNYFAGITMRRKLHLRRGVQLSFSRIQGKVEEVSLLDITLRSAQNELLHVPYTILQREIVQAHRKPKQGKTSPQ